MKCSVHVHVLLSQKVMLQGVSSRDVYTFTLPISVRVSLVESRGPDSQSQASETACTTDVTYYYCFRPLIIS